MTIVPLTDEEGRIAALYRYDLLNGAHNVMLERLARLAKTALGTAISGVTIIDREEVHFRAAIGMSDRPMRRSSTFCDTIVATGRPFTVSDVTEDPRCVGHPVHAEHPDIRAYCGVPLITSDGFVAGSIFVIDTAPRTFTDNDTAVLAQLAKVAIEHLELQQMARYDFLTGAVTRRTFQFEVEREYARAMRYDRPAALVFMDIDQFRAINEVFGHGAGDEAMRAVANRCMETMRQSDVFGRVGGEEFAMLLPETLAYEAGQCAERLRDLVGQLRFKTEKGVRSVTASFGVAPLRSDITSAAHWFADADVALYNAKKAGGNCVMRATAARPFATTAPAGGQPEHIAGKLH